MTARVVRTECTIAEAIRMSEATILEMVDDIRSVTERGDARLDGMSMVRELRLTASLLEQIDYPAVPHSVADVRIRFHLLSSPRKLRRREQRDCATYPLRSIVEYLRPRGTSLPEPVSASVRADTDGGKDKTLGAFYASVEGIILRLEAITFRAAASRNRRVPA
jgi:hypothetical protein